MQQQSSFPMESVVLLTSENMCVYEGRWMVSVSADRSWVLAAGGFQKREGTLDLKDEGRAVRGEEFGWVEE